MLPERILLDEVVCIAVADGAPRPSAPSDWFTARVPTIPPHTGPLHVSGISPGDIVKVEILALAPEHPQTGGPLRATVTITPSADGRAPGPSQVVVPANSIVRLPAQRAGAMLSIGPVVLRLAHDGSWVPIDAWVTIRCTVVHPASG
jgi:acetamidase/formamidase